MKTLKKHLIILSKGAAVLIGGLLLTLGTIMLLIIFISPFIPGTQLAWYCEVLYALPVIVFFSWIVGKAVSED